MCTKEFGAHSARVLVPRDSLAITVNNETVTEITSSRTATSSYMTHRHEPSVTGKISLGGDGVIGGGIEA